MLMHRPQTPQPGFGSITLLQKFTPHFKILDRRLQQVTVLVQLNDQIIRFLSQFFHTVSYCASCQIKKILVKFSGLEFLKFVLKSLQKNQNRRLVSTSSFLEREIVFDWKTRKIRPD